jgi:hypothetical protein
MTGEDGLVAAQYSEASVQLIYNAVTELLGQALEGAQDFESSKEQALKEALQGDCLLLRYDGLVPLDVLAQWLDCKTTRMELSVDTILLTAEGQLFGRDECGALLCAQTRVGRSTWTAAAALLSGEPAAFAGLLDAPEYAALRPETLVLQDDRASFAVLQIDHPSFTDASSQNSLQTLLDAFQYSPYVQSYPENDGATQVFVDNDSTLRVTADGWVRYRTSAADGGIPVYQEELSSNEARLTAQVEFARAAMETALRSIGAVSQVTLEAVTQGTDGSAVVTFRQSYGGVLLDSAVAAARFEFHDGRMTAAEIQLVRCEETGERLYVLPVKQAAAALNGTGNSLTVTYLQTENGTRLLPCRSVRKQEE